MPKSYPIRHLLIAKGNKRREIAGGLHTCVIRLAAEMISPDSPEGDIIFTGGVARNPRMLAFLTEKPGRRVLVPDNPQFIGASGAALLGRSLRNIVPAIKYTNSESPIARD